jgi:hypothetical protein
MTRTAETTKELRLTSNDLTAPLYDHQKWGQLAWSVYPIGEIARQLIQTLNASTMHLIYFGGFIAKRMGEL